MARRRIFNEQKPDVAWSLARSSMKEETPSNRLVGKRGRVEAAAIDFSGWWVCCGSVL
jgi:hypothetical protein